LAAGLLTEPALQSNCVRLEVLAHLSLFAGAGKKKPTRRTLAKWYAELGAGPCAFVEDPAEDAFTSVITTAQGNFRILEGTWESATFFLQRIVNIVESTPGNEGWLAMRESVQAILKLSELVCERSGLERYTFGNTRRETELPKQIELSVSALRKRVVFSVAELKENGISLEALEPFVFHQQLSDAIPESSLTHSPLVHHPLLLRGGQIVVALPTSISVAIRGLVAGGLAAGGLKVQFLHSLAREYEVYFRDHPPLNIGYGAPVCFQDTDNGVMAAVALEVDIGRWLQLIFVLDTLEGFDETAFAGANPDPHALAGDFDKWRGECRAMATLQPHFHGGLTVIIGCGLGRAAYHRLNVNHNDDWRTVYLSAPDVATLTDLRHGDTKTIWRILDAKDLLAAHGVEFINVNGLLNLIAWARSLDGHLVDHGQIPHEWTSGRGRILIDPGMVYDVRREAAARLDRHAVPSADGVWTEVRKTGDSLFADDQEAPFYVPTRMGSDGQIPMIYEGRGRHWWCRITAPREYARWKTMSTWLPRIAAVLDVKLTSLPAIISIDVGFEGYGATPRDDGGELSQEAIDADIRVTVDHATGKVLVATGALFEEGLAAPENIAEAALVSSIVRGCMELAGNNSTVALKTIRKAIVRNKTARDLHAFQARTFRDFVGDQLQHDPVAPDSIDAAALRIGLGWRVRSVDSGEKIEGRVECTSFLNSLVSQLEDELCRDLRTFDRQSLVEVALRNHELGMARQAIWRRTASANLGLHRDQKAVLATIAEQEFENNGVLQTSRVMVEIAVCECLEHDGVVPGEMDLSRLMAKLMLLAQLGDWSDAIFHGAIEASISVTPLGDVHVPTAFIDEIVMPFGSLAHETMVDIAIADYPRNFESPALLSATEFSFDKEFVDAWNEEKRVRLDSFRRFVDDIEDVGIKRQMPVLTMLRSELLKCYSGDDDAAEAIVASMSTMPRDKWRTLPDGMLEKDRWPWRFRRRLSLLRLPIIQLDETADPLVALAPGLLRDALVYTVGNYHQGYFPHSQIRTKSMRAWSGTAADRRGSRFNREVAERLQEFGWRAEADVKVSKVMGKRLDRDYGDVDVLAWSPASKRVLAMECKDLHFHKTAGEVAEQLSDFRGEIRDGKRDLLRKHLDRMDVLQGDAERVAKYVGIGAPLTIECWVVFRNPVPMLFSTEHFGAGVRATTFSKLADL
jgi:hypothetical protein